MNLDPTVLSYSFDPGSDSTKYVIETAFDDARGERRTCTVARRYSMFLELHASIAPQLALPHKLPAKKKLLNTEKVKKQRVDRLQDYLCRAVAAAGPRPPRALALFLGVPEMTEAQLAESVVAEDARFFDSDDAAADASWRRGVSIEFLVAFTNAHGCWDARTDEVVRDVIRPATAAARCRYVDLPAVAAAAAVGPAATFVCHCWGAQWGTLVAALADGAADRSRRVWIDVFAVRAQFGAQFVRVAQFGAQFHRDPPISLVAGAAVARRRRRRKLRRRHPPLRLSGVRPRSGARCRRAAPQRREQGGARRRAAADRRARAPRDMPPLVRPPCRARRPRAPPPAARHASVFTLAAAAAAALGVSPS